MSGRDGEVSRGQYTVWRGRTGDATGRDAGVALEDGARPFEVVRAGRGADRARGLDRPDFGDGVQGARLDPEVCTHVPARGHLIATYHLDSIFDDFLDFQTFLETVNPHNYLLETSVLSHILQQ